MNVLHKQGYSLSALFVLMTSSAALIGGFTPLMRLVGSSEVSWSSVLVATIAGASGGALLGMLIGLLQFRQSTGTVMGAGAGVLIGVSAGLIALLPTAQLPAAAIAMVVGSMLTVGVALINRRINQ